MLDENEAEEGVSLVMPDDDYINYCLILSYNALS